ncbi:MAG: WYL domain-containing protein [Planctomycetota bacterium]
MIFRSPAGFERAHEWLVLTRPLTAGETHVVRIRFTDRAAKHVRESKWHHSQKTTDHADGSLTLQITVENLEEIQAWVLSFGPWAKVLAPQVLIENVRRAAMATAAQYSDQP